MNRAENNGRKAFLFTIDALLALAVVAVALASANALHQSNGLEANPLEALARSYLVEKHVVGAAITMDNFTQLTGLEASESPIVGPVVAKGSLFSYPHALAGCGCNSSSCGLEAGVNDSCLSGQESLAGSLKEVWVAP